jgi:hypothetical protein
MKAVWFKPWGWIYRPIAWPGWLALALVFILCVQVLRAGDRHSHPPSGTLYGNFPLVVPAAILPNRPASQTAAQR